MEKEKFYQILSKNQVKLPKRIHCLLEYITKYNIKGKCYLDIGCNNGIVTKLIANKIGAKQVFGIDISHSAIKKAKKRGIKAFPVDIDKKDLPFDNETFDVITMLEVIEHLFDPDHALQEVNRVLKKSGWFIISTPNLSYWLNRLIFLLGYKPYGYEISTKYLFGEPGVLKKGAAGHIRVFPYKSLVKMLQYYNFKIAKTIPIGIQNTNKLIKVIDRIFNFISPSFSQVVILFLKKINKS